MRQGRSCWCDVFATDANIIRADANEQNSAPKNEWDPSTLDPETVPRAVQEYLEVLDDAAFGAANEAKPKFTSHSDPASQWTGALKGPAFFAYSDNYLIDTDHAIIVDVEASRSIRQAEVGATRAMIRRTGDKFGLYPEILAVGTAYSTSENLNWLVNEEGILPHIPVFDKSRCKDGTFEKRDFIYDHEKDAYICPVALPLRPAQRIYRNRKSPVDANGMVRYRASKYDCDGRLMKPYCCPKEPSRKIQRHIYEGARDLARELSLTDAYVASQRRRKKVEMLFAHLKRIMKLDRLRLRGPNGAKDEFLLLATAQNLRKLAKLIPMPAGSQAESRSTRLKAPQNQRLFHQNQPLVAFCVHHEWSFCSYLIIKHPAFIIKLLGHPICTRYAIALCLCVHRFD